MSAIEVQWLEEEKVTVPHSDSMQYGLIKSEEFENSYPILYILLKS